MAEKEKTPKDPMSYTHAELEAMRIDKSCVIQYRDIMKYRKKVIRAAKTKKREENRDPTGEEIDRIRRENKSAYNKLVKSMGKKNAKQLQHNLDSSTQYPPDTMRDWQMTIRAIERGIWHPTTPQLGSWHPPKKKNAYDRFMGN